MHQGRRPLAAAAALLLLAPAARAGPPGPERAEALAPGIEHRSMTWGGESPEADRFEIHVLVLDPSRARLAVAHAMDEVLGTETTSSLATRRGALAAVNGGYFRTSGLYRGEPAGALALGGRLLSEPDRGRPVAAIAGGGPSTRVAVARLHVAAELVVDRRHAHAVHGFNRPRGADELVVFTPEFHRTTLTGPGGAEVMVERGRARDVQDGVGSRTIPPEGFVASGAGEARRWLLGQVRPGTRVDLRVDTRLAPALPFAPDAILGGGPWLLHGGEPAEPLAEESYAEEFRKRRHPRTALGLRPDGTLLLVTVDGRQPGKSVGMTIDELTALMRELGTTEAINLDGGGSTTMVVRGGVVNSPSDPTGERPVSDAILVFAR